MLSKILIANRGEIAVRIIRTCREMGIRTVAVYSEVDAHALHTHMADEAIAIGPAPAHDSYLQTEKLVEAALKADADAVHPGYGFLSENPAFAEAVTNAGLIWIGPSATTMRAVSSKSSARALMRGAGVPVIPGYQESQNLEDLTAAAARLGYPVLVKAAAGGGGKGMRLVHGPDELESAVDSARREAQAAFGDDQLFLEKYLAQPRHVEVQVLGDLHGNILHLHERECSIQRRHQKIVEESPSPALHPELRARMGAAAVEAAKTVAYVGAGTVEFLLDEEEKFYFLEMNTRLQVEHPVTELITGLDLVRWQIRIANGDALPWKQHQIAQQGHAIECRIYAEDPANGFVPSTGRILRLQEPMGPGIRVDSGIRPGDEISRFYDPLLAKIIVHAENRAAAVNRMQRALEEFILLGDLETNAPFLQDVIVHPVFQAGETNTTFVEEHFGDWQPFSGRLPDEAVIAAALTQLAEESAAEGTAAGPWEALSGFRI